MIFGAPRASQNRGKIVKIRKKRLKLDVQNIFQHHFSSIFGCFDLRKKKRPFLTTFSKTPIFSKSIFFQRKIAIFHISSLRKTTQNRYQNALEKSIAKKLLKNRCWRPLSLPKTSQNLPKNKEMEKNRLQKKARKKERWKSSPRDRSPPQGKLFGTPKDHPTTFPMICTLWSAPRRPNHQKKSFNPKCSSHVWPNGTA